MMSFEDRLVVWAEQIVNSAREGLKRHEDTGRSQASNAVDVAKTANSVRVFRNWLRYQKSREEFWQVNDTEGKDLAERVSEVVERIGRETSGDETMKAVVRFLGYFRRTLVAVDHLGQIPAATDKGE